MLSELRECGYRAELVNAADIELLGSRAVTGAIAIALDDRLNERWSELPNLPLVRLNAASSHRDNIYSVNSDGDGFFSDIISALSNGDIKTMAYHSTKYWSKQGTKEKEIFANLFSMGVFDQKKHIDLINEIFPEVYEAYNEIRKDV